MCRKIWKKEENANSLVVGELYNSNLQVLEIFIRKNPLLEPKTVRAELLKMKQKFTKLEIIKKIQDVRNELFPKENLATFTPLFCSAIDSNLPEYNLFKLYLNTPYIPKTTNLNNQQIQTQQIVILANNTMLKQLSGTSQWFIDATFKVAPKNFLQILDIVVYIPHINIFFPACYAIMTHKSEESYSLLFSNLKIIAQSLKFLLNPQMIMCDFEIALRNSLKKTFPEAKISGCYFHYTKCLYDKAKTLGLKRRQLKKQTYALICYLQILIHCPIEERKTFFEKIENHFKNIDNNFTTFLKYYKKNWLEHPFLDELFEALKTNQDLGFIRTNNPCETFHLFLSNNLSDIINFLF